MTEQQEFRDFILQVCLITSLTSTLKASEIVFKGSCLPLKTIHLQNKVASFKRSQCEGCSIIIYLMALYDYYLKYIQGRHIKHIFKLSI